MKYIEHRRHSKRNEREIHLNQAGVDLARDVGANMRDFSLVVSSSSDRAMETAIAMGYAVDIISDELATMNDDVLEDIGGEWEIEYTEIRKHLERHGPLFEFAQFQIKYMMDMIEKINDDEKALFVSHGGVIDYPLVALLMDEDHSKWGPLFNYCEGYRITIDEGKIVNYELFRIQS